MAVIFIFGSLYLGEIQSFYQRFWWWNIALHASLTAELGDARLQAHTLDKELNTEQKLAALVDRDREKWREVTQSEKAWDPHLRSTHDVSGHHIQAADGEIGHAEDFIIDEETWAIHYLIIDAQNWWPGEKVLVSPQWIERVSWSESKPT